MYVEVPLKSIHPNPYRDIDNYPLDEKKLEALRESIGSTGWWENLVCRPHPTRKGHVELAYGHHRMAVLRELWKPTDKVGMVQQDLTDTDMWRIMARENMEQYTPSAAVDVGTAASWIAGIADGSLDAPVVPKKVPKAGLRSMSAPAGADIGYTATNLATEAGWHRDRAKRVLGLVDGLEAGLFKAADLKGIGTRSAAELYSGLISANKQMENKVKKQPELKEKAKVVKAAIKNEAKAVTQFARAEAADGSPVSKREARDIAQKSKARLRKEDIKQEKAKKAQKNWGEMAKAVVGALGKVDILIDRADIAVRLLIKHRAEAAKRSRVAERLLNQAGEIINRMDVTTSAWAAAFNEDAGTWDDTIIDADYVVIDVEVQAALPAEGE